MPTARPQLSNPVGSSIPVRDDYAAVARMRVNPNREARPVPWNRASRVLFGAVDRHRDAGEDARAVTALTKPARKAAVDGSASRHEPFFGLRGNTRLPPGFELDARAETAGQGSAERLQE